MRVISHALKIYCLAGPWVTAQDEGDDSVCTTAGDCTGLLLLPPSLEVTLGAPLAAGQVPTVQELKAQGRLPYVSSMGRSGTNPEIAFGAKFRNFLRTDLSVFYDDGTPQGAYSGKIPSKGRMAITTYSGHRFKLRTPAGGDVATYTMDHRQTMYIMHPPPDDTEMLDSKVYKGTLEEQQFMLDYEKREGRPWLAFWPRQPPTITIWPAAHVGQRHVVSTPNGFMRCKAASNDAAGCWDDPSPLSLTLEVVSTSPRVFVIENLLSEDEVEHIVHLGKNKLDLSRSMTGSHESNTRTSSTGWLKRDSTPILSRLYNRFADVLGIPSQELDHDKRGENLQVVRYGKGQEYMPHHDFAEQGVPEQRVLTLLLHVEPAARGGATLFPKAADGTGLSIKPPRGSAVLFYNMLPDGNSDDSSLHAGAPVEEGIKWACNLWVWDPKFSTRAFGF